MFNKVVRILLTALVAVFFATPSFTETLPDREPPPPPQMLSPKTKSAPPPLLKPMATPASPHNTAPQNTALKPKSAPPPIIEPGEKPVALPFGGSKAAQKPDVKAPASSKKPSATPVAEAPIKPTPAPVVAPPAKPTVPPLSKAPAKPVPAPVAEPPSVTPAPPPVAEAPPKPTPPPVVVAPVKPAAQSVAVTTINSASKAVVSAPQVTLASAVDHVYKLKMPLIRFYGFNSIDLRCIFGSGMIQIPLPNRWNIESAKLNLTYSYSSSLIPAMSNFMVRVNNNVVYQKKPDLEETEKVVTVDIPPKILKADYNDFVFEASQHYLTTNVECAPPCDPSLWTKVNLEDSYLEVEYTLLPIQRDLGNTVFLYDPKLITDGKINFVLDNFADNTLTVAGTVASGIAKKFNYRRVNFSISQEILPGVDNVLVGDRNFVNRVLDRYGVEVKTDLPLIKLMYLPDHLESQTQTENPRRLFVDPTHSLVIITAKNMNNVRIASNTFTSMNFPYPGTDEMTIQSFSMPEITLYGGKNIVNTEKIYKLSALGFKTHTFKGMQPPQRSLSFRLPVDFMIRQNDYAKLALNFTYGAGMRPDSVFNVQLNGQQVRSIALNNPSGDLITGYKLDLPTYLFKPGANVITFEPILTPFSKGCELLQPEAFFFTLFENSTFFLPSMPHLIELPKVELFAINGFPMTRWPDGFDSRIYLPRADKNTVSAALNVMALMTQLNGYPLLAMEITTEKFKNYKGELMIIGSVESIPDELWVNAPLRLGRVSEAPYPATTNLEEASGTFVHTKQTSGIGPKNAALMQFQSPFKKGHSVLLLTAESTANVLRLSEGMFDPSVLANIAGDLNIIGLDQPEYMVKSMSFQKKYLTGQKGEVSGLDAFLFTNTWIYYVLMLLIILVPTAIIYIWAKRNREKRGDVEHKSPDKRTVAQKIRDLLKAIFLRGKPKPK